jgi:methionyl-tRNA formyltransferase
LEADMFVVVAFRMMPEVLWQMPPLGTINLHGSLLPQYRGAAPINWAVINGETETGLTTFKLVHAIDMGSIIHQVRVPITDSETVGDVYAKLLEAGSPLVLRTVNEMAVGQVTMTPQVLDATLHHAPKIYTETCHIDWTAGIDRCYNLIRGLSPYPAAWTMLDGKTLKIFKTEKVKEAHKQPVGIYTTDSKTYIHYYCPDGYLSLLDIQLAGKKRMPIQDFLRGYKPIN